jgi:nicotinamidase-related amidase
MNLNPVVGMRLEAKKTALILIDLQNGIMSAPNPAPHSCADVMKNAARLAKAVRAKGGTVVYIRVDMNDVLRLPVDAPLRDPNAPPLPATASEIAAAADFQAGDWLITKRHWGAFAGTELERKLRERGIDTIVLGGVSTNAGVESTARQGTGLGFAFVVAEDACTSSMGSDAHRFAMEKVFPRLARVRTVDEVIAALG